MTIVGSALVTTVLDSIATNIASSRPERASMISRCVIGAGAASAGVPEVGWSSVVTELSVTWAKG